VKVEVNISESKEYKKLEKKYKELQSEMKDFEKDSKRLKEYKHGMD
jgi:chromosome segregation ATPase